MTTTNRERFSSVFYWVAVATTVLSVGSVLLGNTKFVAPYEHTSFPLAWKFATVAVVSYLFREICNPARHENVRDSRHSLDHIPHEI